MNKPGPNPKSDSKRRAEGNPGRKPVPNKTLKTKSKPKIKLKIKAPAPSNYLINDVNAFKEWKRITRLMVDVGMITELDLSILEEYCITYSLFVKATLRLRLKGISEVINTPNNFPIQHPWLNVRNKCIEQLRLFGRELGLSPSARSSLVVNDELSEALRRSSGVQAKPLDQQIMNKKNDSQSGISPQDVIRSRLSGQSDNKLAN